MFSRIFETERPALLGDDVADVLGVALATAGEDLVADRVELAADRLDVLVTEMGDGVVGLLLDGGHGEAS
jgi:hypothetical protein